MKRLLILFLLTLSLSANAQNKKKLFYLLNQQSGVSYADEYQNILTAAGVNAPNEFQSVGFNKGISIVAESTLWNKIHGWYYFKDINKAFGKINLKNPGTFDITEVGTVDYTSGQGINSSNTSSFYSTGINPTVVTVLGYSVKNYITGANQGLIGTYNTASNTSYIIEGGSLRYAINNNRKAFTWPSFISISNISQRDYNQITLWRDAGTNYLYFSSKNLSDSDSQTNLAPANAAIAISAVGLAGGTASLHQTAGRTQIAAVFNSILTAPELFKWYWANRIIESGATAVWL